jgi:hypothetical protein
LTNVKSTGLTAIFLSVYLHDSRTAVGKRMQNGVFRITMDATEEKGISSAVVRNGWTASDR